MTVPPDGTQPPYNPVQPGDAPPPPPGYQPAYPGYQQPGYQQPGQPGYQPGYQQPPKKSNTLRTVLIIVGVVAVLCCAGLVAGGFWIFSTAKNAIGPARSAAVEFVEDLEADNAPGAYAKLCDATQAKFTEQDLIRVMASQPRIVGHTVTGFNVNTTNGETTADITMELTDESGASGHHTFHLVKEDGAWYVCGNPY